MIIIEEIQTNINRIDFELKEVFENVSIIEKADRLGHFFEIQAGSKFLFEDNSWRNASVRLKVYKTDLLSENIRWFYQVDTLNESSDWIERVSPVEFLAIDVNNVILLKQMSEDYFSKLEPIVEVINESSTSQESNSVEQKVEAILKNYNVQISEVAYGDEIPLFENNGFMNTKPDKKIYFLHEQVLKMSDRFMIESAIKLIPGVNYVSFSDNDVMIDYSPQ